MPCAYQWGLFKVPASLAAIDTCKNTQCEMLIKLPNLACHAVILLRYGQAEVIVRVYQGFKNQNLLFSDERIRSQASTPTDEMRASPTLLNRWRKYIEPLSDSDSSTGSVEGTPVRRPKTRCVSNLTLSF